MSVASGQRRDGGDVGEGGSGGEGGGDSGGGGDGGGGVGGRKKSRGFGFRERSWFKN